MAPLGRQDVELMTFTVIESSQDVSKIDALKGNFRIDRLISRHLQTHQAHCTDRR